MAQLKDTIITGSLRVTDTTYTNNLNLSSGTASQIVKTDASKNLITGSLAASEIPNLSANKITSDTLSADRIPNLAASKINSGTFDAARIPNLAASKINSGTFDAARIPNLSATKITSDTLTVARGGTGKDSWTQWGVLYASASTTLTNTAAGTAGYLLQSNATSAPSWIQATNSNTANTVVKRDASGNFSAGTITASLTGNVTGNCSGSSGSCTGNAATVTTTADTTNELYILGVTSGATTTIKRDTSITVKGGTLTATEVKGAVWNDYAEYRKSDLLPPGACVQENDNGKLTASDHRLIPGCSIISDTYGFSQGETDDAHTPVAVSGRVLAYTFLPRYMYHAGMAVCSAPGGTIDIMTRKEIQEYPDCIIGYVSEIPDYEEWGTGNVKVNGRIWIKVK